MRSTTMSRVMPVPPRICSERSTELMKKLPELRLFDLPHGEYGFAARRRESQKREAV
jgi:hypothetical protein